MSSATSSASSSVFDRSSTPSSISSSDYSDFCAPHPPTTFVHLPTKKVEPNVLNAIFETYARKGYLGLLLPCDEEQRSCLNLTQWQKEYVVPEGYTEGIEIFVSVPGETFEQDDTTCAPIVTTDPIVSKHLLSFSRAELRAVLSVPAAEGYVAHTLERPSVVFPPLSHTPGFSVTSGSWGNVPTLQEWHNLWSAWDLVTLRMIPQEMLHQKPIDLRHKPLFYIGHIPTFLDMLLNKAIGGGASEPQYFWKIFERGIDPHVDDPEHCHNHSEVPEKDDDWPTLDTIMVFRNRVRTRLAQLYNELQTGKRLLTRNIARTLVMTLEHEGFHIETLLYMLIQRAGSGTLPPLGVTPPPWEILEHQWSANPLPPSKTVDVGPATVTLGHADSEGDDRLEGVEMDVDGHVFGWDNESPPRKYEVVAFRAEWRPVSNLEYSAFWEASGSPESGLPGSWVEEDGEIKVRTMYGPVPMKVAQHWPVLSSYDQLSAYARSKGGRLPTEIELRLFLDTYDVGHEGGANVGFRNWHPVPATAGMSEYGGKGSNGGVWEWTSTLFDGHEGLSPTNLFTGYSTDFFDTKHQVVLGASYATIPRLAGRRTVRNFYQHNYPFAWVGGRVVYDL